MIRLYVDQPLVVGRSIGLPQNELHYLKNVRREQGEVRLFNQAGQSASGRLEGSQFIVDSVENQEANVFDLTVAVGLPEASVVAKLIAGVSELGVKSLTFFGAERSQAAKKRRKEKTERLQRLALESARQSGRTTPLEVEFRESVKDLDFETFERIWVFDEESGESPSLKPGLQLKRGLVVVGCEGGWSAAERDFISSLKNVAKVHLDTPILRVQTAAICASFFGIQHFLIQK